MGQEKNIGISLKQRTSSLIVDTFTLTSFKLLGFIRGILLKTEDGAKETGYVFVRK